MTPQAGNSAHTNPANHPLIDTMHYDFFDNKHYLFGSTRSAKHNALGNFVGLFKVAYSGSLGMPSSDQKFCKLVPGQIKNSNIAGMYPKLLSDGSGNARLHFIINYDQTDAYYFIFDFLEAGHTFDIHRIKRDFYGV